MIWWRAKTPVGSYVAVVKSVATAFREVANVDLSPLESQPRVTASQTKELICITLSTRYRHDTYVNFATKNV